MSMFSKIRYYATSAATLLSGLDDPLQTALMFLGWPNTLPTEIRLRRSGWRFKIRTRMDAWIIKETCLDEEYFRGVDAIEPDWVVVDIGAGLGDFTVIASKRCPDGVVHAYEPLANSYALLEQNLAINEVTNVIAYNLAVAAQDGQLALEKRDVEPVTARFAPDAAEDAVGTATLSDILDSLPQGRCDFMKIDCEGCEFDLILNSSHDVLARIQRIILEYHAHVTDYSRNDLEIYLSRHGFSVQRRRNPVHSYLGLLYAERI